jgi:uncharacterized RDD family membrane protein YckC
MMATGYRWQVRAPATAGTMKRALAFGLDSVIISLLAWTIAFAFAALGILRIPDVEFFGQRSPAFGLFWIVIIFEGGIGLVYSTLFEWSLARTPGKMICSLRVARIGGGKPSLFESFLRNLLRLLWVTPFFAVFIVIDLWSLRTTELDQRLGDLAAGTVVIDERAAAENA